MKNQLFFLLLNLFISPIVSYTQSWNDDNYTSYRVRLYENTESNKNLFFNDNGVGLIQLLQKNSVKSTDFKGILFHFFGGSSAELQLKKDALLKVQCTETVQKDLYGDIRLNAKGETITVKTCDSIYYLFPKEDVEWQVTEKLVSLKDDWELDEITLYHYIKNGDRIIKTPVFSIERDAYLSILKTTNASDFFLNPTLESQVVCKMIDRFEELNTFTLVNLKKPCVGMRYELFEKEQLGFVKKASSDQSLLYFLSNQLINGQNLLYDGDFNFESAYYASLSQLQNEVGLKEGIGFYWVPEGETYSDYTATIAIKDARGDGGDFTRKMVYHPAKLSDLVEIRLKKEVFWDSTNDTYHFQTVAFCPVFERSFDGTMIQTNHVWYSLEKAKKHLNGEQPYWINLLESKTIMGLLFGEYNCVKN